jgi:hypothetical protein
MLIILEQTYVVFTKVDKCNNVTGDKLVVARIVRLLK